MKKQMLSILTMSLILIFLFIPSMLAEEEAVNMLYSILQKQRGYTREQLSVNQMEYSDGRWGFSLTIIDHPEDEDGLVPGRWTRQADCSCWKGLKNIVGRAIGK